MNLKAISLFSGIGGIDIAFSAAGFDIIAQVEIDDFCRRILKKHKARYWPNAALFTDVRVFGRAQITGPVDVIAGGFPCQPFSIAGKQKGAADHRNLWPEFQRIIGEIRPRAVLLENVPNITGIYGTTIIGDLAALGYDARWGIVSAADAGAPQVRERWWVVAYANQQRRQEPCARHATPYKNRKYSTCQPGWPTEFHAPQPSCKTLGHTQGQRCPETRQYRARQKKRIGRRGKTLGITQTQGLSQRGNRSGKDQRKVGETADHKPIHRPRRPGRCARRRQPAQSRLGRAAHGIPAWLDQPRWPVGQGPFQFTWEAPRTIPSKTDPYRVQRVKALGNAVMPQVVYPLACGIRDELLGAQKGDYRRHHIEGPIDDGN